MPWFAIVGFWGSWVALTILVSVVVFLMTVFTGDNPRNRDVSERIIGVFGVLVLLAIGGGIGAMLYWPGWHGWLAACGLTLLIPVVILSLANAWLK